MTSAYDVHEQTDAPPPRGLDSALAMVGYVCLFVTVLFAGIPAFVALILATVRLGDADPVTRTHLRFQIRLFWWAFWLTVLAMIGLVVALVFGFSLFTPWRNQLVMPDGRSLDNNATLLVLIAATAAAWLGALLCTWVGSVWGAIKLASGRPMGRV